MYEYLISPKNGKKVLLNSKQGKKILKNYILRLLGGAASCCRDCNYCPEIVDSESDPESDPESEPFTEQSSASISNPLTPVKRKQSTELPSDMRLLHSASNDDYGFYIEERTPERIKIENEINFLKNQAVLDKRNERTPYEEARIASLEAELKAYEEARIASLEAPLKVYNKLGTTVKAAEVEKTANAAEAGTTAKAAEARTSAEAAEAHIMSPPSLTQQRQQRQQRKSQSIEDLFESLNQWSLSSHDTPSSESKKQIKKNV